MKSLNEILGMEELEWHKQCREELHTEKIEGLIGNIVDVRDRSLSNIFTYSNDLAFDFYVKHSNNTKVHCADVIRHFTIVNEEFELFEIDDEHRFLVDVPLFFGVNGFYLISKLTYRFFYLGKDEKTDVSKIPVFIKKYLIRDDYFYTDLGKDKNVLEEEDNFRFNVTNFLNQWNMELLGDDYKEVKVLNEIYNKGFTVRFLYVTRENNLYIDKSSSRKKYYLYRVNGFYVEVLESNDSPLFQYYYGKDLGKATSIYNSTVKSFK